MVERVINQLILTAGALKEHGPDKRLERQFETYLKELQRLTGTDEDGAGDLILAELSRLGAAA